MEACSTDASLLASEYAVLVEESGWGRTHEEAAETQLKDLLVSAAEWTPDGAAEILRLARTHGAFVLRNALALAVAMALEDGTTGR